MEEQTDGPALEYELGQEAGPEQDFEASQEFAGPDVDVTAPGREFSGSDEEFAGPGQKYSAPAGTRAATGEPRVDAALARLDELAGQPVAGHRAIFEDVHRRLRDVLGELDTRQAQAGGRPGR